MISRMLVAKYRFGMPFHRFSEMLSADGIRLDDSMKCRYAEHVGATLGCIVQACVKDAKENAFCLSTDATRVSIQAKRTSRTTGKRDQPCRKGHFFVVLADQDHIFFEDQPKHASAIVCQMFRGFGGYIQADAHVIYHALYRGDARVGPDDTPPREVGCWAHVRRKFREAATTVKDPASEEALFRIRGLFQIERDCDALAPARRYAKRLACSKPLVDKFFAWVKVQYRSVQGVRGLVATAFGHAARQESGLRRFLDGGRLPLTNRNVERALRNIATGRRSWFFFGSDDHAAAAANLFSLIASCKLHGLDPETHLAEIVHIVPY